MYSEKTIQVALGLCGNTVIGLYIRNNEPIPSTYRGEIPDIIRAIPWFMYYRGGEYTGSKEAMQHLREIMEELRHQSISFGNDPLTKEIRRCSVAQVPYPRMNMYIPGELNHIQ